ncbi:ArsR/SmtB family transcription factor [Pseudogemmobacter sp. W21_MBD1_M6]|uniref:ArsR/SmtB family transcription factor n=1 Tax=Pseudogemmobacter sp. W21_MBD1_M6 TaxID=3240271 RepID=UPI003F97144D
MTNHNANLDSVFRALADPTRRAVLARLAIGPSSIGELAEPFDMALPSFLQHVKVLEHCGLVRTQKQGRVRTCRIEPGRIAEAEHWLSQQRQLREGQPARLSAYPQQEQDL